MSEHQVIAFRAVDAPVSKENLDYMRKQSTRATITPWAFDNEYHYGDFQGNVREMMKRGYDLHLHYANFGIRSLVVRLPTGFPDPAAAAAYLGTDSPKFDKDKNGPGGLLRIESNTEPGELDELWDIETLVDRLVPLRAEILNGDLRPLYLAHLANACHGPDDPEETTEALVPAGLDNPSDAQRALMEFYELSDSLIAAAARGVPSLPARTDPATQFAAWLRRQPTATKDEWLLGAMIDPNAPVGRTILAEYRKEMREPLQPTSPLNRTIAALESAAEEIQQESKKQADAALVAERAKRLAAMAADPAATIRETERLVALRSTVAYREIAELLTDLREALAGSKQAHLAEDRAKALKRQYPRYAILTGALRRAGLLPK